MIKRWIIQLGRAFEKLIRYTNKQGFLSIHAHLGHVEIRNGKVEFYWDSITTIKDRFVKHRRDG